MANKPKGYGLTAELEKKKAGKFDVGRANETMAWVKEVISYKCCDDAHLGKICEVKEQGDVQAILKDGVILCKLINAMYPGCVKRINNSTMAFKQMENISNFLSGCEEHGGLKKMDLFQTVDLYEASNIPVVIDALYSLGRKAHDSDDQGMPALGPKEATENKREFTDEQMAAGKNVIGLQMGSNQGASQAGQNFGKTRSIMD